MLDHGPETPEVNPAAPDVPSAEARIAAFEREHSGALLDPNTPTAVRQSLLKERSRLYAGAYGSDPATGLDVSSDGPVQPGDHAAAIGRVLGRYGGQGEGAAALAGELAGVGLTAAEIAPLAQEITSSSPMSEGQLLARVPRSTMRDAAAYLAANPQLDELIGERELWRYPGVLREAARRHRESR